jgi:hypothetical protein
LPASSLHRKILAIIGTKRFLFCALTSQPFTTFLTNAGACACSVPPHPSNLTQQHIAPLFSTFVLRVLGTRATADATVVSLRRCHDVVTGGHQPWREGTLRRGPGTRGRCWQPPVVVIPWQAGGALAYSACGFIVWSSGRRSLAAALSSRVVMDVVLGICDAESTTVAQGSRVSALPRCGNGVCGTRLHLLWCWWFAGGTVAAKCTYRSRR